MLHFTVPDMSCGHCAGRITTAIHTVDPQAKVLADPPAREVKIASQADRAALVAALTEAGYPPQAA